MPVLRQHRNILIKAISICAGLLAWQLLGMSMKDVAMMPTPSIVIVALTNLFVTGEIWKHIYASMSVFLFGMVLATIVGVLLGFLWAHSSFMENYIQPWITFFFSVPRIAFVPLLVLSFGINDFTRSLVVFLGAVFQILYNTYFGIKGVDQEAIETAVAFNATKVQIFRYITVPAALPFLLTGLRLGVARGLMGIAVAEWFGARAGLGFFVYFSGQTFNTPNYFAGIVIFAILSIILDESIRLAEVKFTPWGETGEI